jgi:hypothetical protein
MPQVNERHLRQLQGYLVGKPRPNGELDMLCPFHGDSKRSASINVYTGAWHCFACGASGGILDLIRRKRFWIPPGRNGNSNGRVIHVSGSPDDVEQEIVTEGHIKGWHSALLANETALDYLIGERGIHTKTLAEFDIGWDVDKKVYTIPIRGPKKEIWNIRRYTTRPGRTKIWNVTGMRPCELYPMNQLESDRIVICGGEWDALATIQHGYATVTRTASEETWQNRWNRLFKGKIVYLCHDADETGQSANKKVADQIKRFADVRIVKLPYEITEKNGKDLSDFWLEYDNADFETLLAEARPWVEHKETEPEIVTVLDSFDARRVAEPIKLQVTIKGKKDPGYTVPWKAKLACTRDAGAKCNVCPLFVAEGKADVEIPPTSPQILGMLGSSSGEILDMIRQEYGAVKCNKLTIEVEEHQAVEELFARPALDHSDGTKARDYKNLKITSVGRHDTMANTTVQVTGALYPNPRDQRNDFLAWDVIPQETSVDRFELNGESAKLLKMFQPRRGQRPLQKLGIINRELAAHVTRIVGRPEMHAMMDLTFHSLLSFKFGGQVVNRGWIESLIVGDTRTGKSEAAERLVRHFGAGEIVGGEASTLAGLIGGMQQIGGRDWAVTWGVIPVNDRRLVVIDEISGLSQEDIGKMSDVRASGMARLTKILQEVTYARTRLLWLGNPRNGGTDQYTYGVDAIRPLIGNPEDIARFDLAMTVAKGDVPAEEFNRRLDTGKLHYSAEACHTMLMWCWTRGIEDVTWARGAEDEVYKTALALGERYVEDPPLVQAANVRIKVARVAVALAARTFSTDKACERVVVTKEHVQDAVKFIDRIYEMPSFGYAELSKELIEDKQAAEGFKDDIRTYLLTHKGLPKLLRTNTSFRRQDIEEVLNMDREQANAVVNKLWSARMIRKDGADCKVEPTLHDLIREIRW